MKVFLRLLLVVFFLSSGYTALATKLYWVGGSGNFNDPAHWSLESGGQGGVKTPGSGDDVYFDENSFDATSVISIIGRPEVNDLIFSDETYPVVLFGTSNEQLIVNGNFKVNPWVDNKFEGQFWFKSNHSVTTCFLSHLKFNGDLYFEGNTEWVIQSNISTSNNASVYFNKGRFNLDNVGIYTGSFIAGKYPVVINANNTFFDIKNKFWLQPDVTYNDVKTSIRANINDPTNYIVPQDFHWGSNSRMSNSTMSCSITLTSTTNAKCPSGCDGIAVFNISGGCTPAPFCFNWTPNGCFCGAPPQDCTVPVGNYTVTNISACAGAYNVSVTDTAGNFIQSLSVPITAPSQFNVFFTTKVKPTCNGKCNGYIRAIITGGTSPYCVQWTPPGTNHCAITGVDTLKSACAGTYTVVITDANSCVSTSTFTTTLSQPPVITHTISSVSILCNGQCNGSVTENVSGGTSPFVFAWSPAGGSASGTSTTSTYTNLCAGSYTVIATDANGCKDTASTTVVQPQPITFTKNPASGALTILCNNTCNGSIGVTGVSGGTGAYTFAWAPAGGTVTNTANSSTYSGLCGSVVGTTYTCTIKDANNCSVTATFTITTPPALSNTIAVTQPKCVAGQGSSVGSATVTESGGVAGYTFAWSPTVTISGATPKTIGSNMSPGTYTVLVTDANGCLDTANVTITAPPALSGTMTTMVNPTCPSLSNGQLCVTASGGTGAYTYTWTPMGGSANCTPATLTVTAGGTSTYTVKVTDANTCTVSVTATLNSPPQATVNAAVTNPPCAGVCNGSATLTPVGGSGNYTYVWSCSGTTLSSISGQCGGSTCNYTVTDAVTNCKYTGSVSFTVAPTMTVNASSTALPCYYSCNSTITTTVSGGTSGYTYSWTPGGGTTPNLVNQCAGNHTVTVTDALGCTATKTVAVTGPSVLSNTVIVANPKCVAGQGSSVGSATVTESGGTAGYTFAWSPTVTTGCATPKSCGSNMPVGTYTVIITDANNCLDTATVTLNPPTPVSGTITTTTNPTCPNLNNGQLCVTASGGTSPYSYTWSPTGGNSNCSAATLTVTAGGSSVYTVTVKDQNTCTVVVTGTLTSPPQATVTSAVTNASCGSAPCTASATLTPSGGSGTFTYQWSCSGSTTPVISNQCAGTTCNYTVTDAGTNCKYTGSVTFTPAPPALVVNASATALSCAGDCNSVITTTVTGGTSGYTYSWTGTGANPVNPTSATQSNMCAGNYSVTVTDALGCTKTATVAITAPPALTVTLNATQPTCNSACNGSINAVVTGGTMPNTSTVNWSPSVAPNPPSTLNPTGLCGTVSPGTTYTLTVTDNNGCVGTGTATIVAPTLFTVTAPQTDVTCSGLCNGSATATPSGGTAPYAFSWDGGAFGNSTTVSGLCAGTHTLNAKDTNACTAQQIITITQPNPILAGVTNVQNTCGPCTGSATANPSGGTPPYTYTWSPAGGGGPVGDSLCIGNYTLTVGDANNCPTSSTTFTINAIIVVNITATSQSVSCNGACDGVVSATASSGTAPYTITWSVSPTYSLITSCSSVTTCSVGGLCPGNYYIAHAVDQNGCMNSDSISIGNPPLLTATVTPTNATCFGSCNGSATVTPSGGTAPYTVNWSTGASGTTINNLCPGAYTVSVLDSRGCSVVHTFTVNSNSQLGYSTSNTAPIACAGSNGSISVTGTGGTAPYTFTWNPTGGGTVTTTSPTSTLSGIPAGIYSVTITDQNGCDTTVQLTLSDPGAPTISVTTTSVSCFGVCDGAATVTATGTAPVTMTWQFGSNLSSPINQSNMCAGTYSVQAQDGNGCSAFQNVVINGPSQITDAPVSMVNPGCSGPTGSIQVTPGGGSGSGYNFNWDGGAQTTNPATNLAAGTHTLVITDGTSCSQTFTFALSSTTQPTLTVNSVNPTCSYLTNGSANVSVSGGVPQYTLTWSSASAGVISSGPNDYTVTGLPANSYTVSLTDSVGCTTQQTFTLTSPTAIAPNFTKTDNLCNTGCTGTACVSPTGGTPGYSYLWSPGGQTTACVNGLCPLNYTVVVSDTNSCTDTVAFTITAPPALVVSENHNDVLCHGACTGTATLSISGGTPGYTTTWSPNACFNCTMVSNLCAGPYTANVTDTNGCAASVIVTIAEPAALLSTLTPKSPLCAGDCNASIYDTTTGGAAPYTYTWSASGGGSVISTTTSSTYTNLCVGSYTVYTTDANGCKDSASSTISNPVQSNVTYLSTDATCNQCDGSVTITSMTGATPITVNWLSPSTCGSATVCTNMCAGIYTVELINVNGCKDSVFIPISNPNGPKLDSVVTNVDCFGGSTGSIFVTVTQGANLTTPYSFTWTPAGTVTTTTSTSTNSGLAATVNPYIVAVADSIGCITTNTFAITQPSKINDNGNSANATCQGVNDGTITSIASGGTPSMAGGTATYTYTLDGTVTNTTGSFTGVGVGQHTVCISDSLGCSVCNVYNIAGNIVILSNISSTNVNCFGNCNGTATISNLNGGVAPYVISWNDPNAQTGLLASNLCIGNYTATITDTNGCQATQTVSITQPPQLSVSAAITAPNCTQCNGSISVTSAGGTPGSTGYTYQWNTGANTPGISNVCAGVWQVTIKDSIGCQKSFQVPVSNNNGPVGTVTVSSPACGNACNGSATVTATGTAPFTYFWPMGGQTTPSVSGLCAGLYFVQVKDSIGCITTDSVQINQGTVLHVASNMVNPGCNVCNGTISVTVSGGGNNYLYNWQPGGATNDTLTGLCAGMYTLVTTDVASGCKDTSLIGLNNNTNGPTLTFSTTNALCNGQSNGTATVTATNGTPGYTYQWTSGTNDTNAVVTGLSSWNSPYGVLVTDANGCIQTGQITISQPNQLIASTPIVSPINCSGTCNGAINLVVAGGTPGYNYAWSPSAITGSSATNLCAGNYSVAVTDTNGCTVNVFDTLVAPPALVITGTVTPTTCSNASDGAINTTTTGGTPTYSWQWSGGSSATTANLSNISTGTYTVVVTDLKNCTDTANFTVNSTVTITVNAGKDTTACGIQSLTLNGVANAGTSVIWAQVPNPPGPVIGNTATVTVNPAIGTTQYVLVGTNGGCSMSDTISVTSNPIPTPDAGTAMSTFTNFSVTLGGNPTNPSGGNVWWSPGGGLNDSTLTNPVVTSPSVTTTYTVYETNSFGCIAMDTITITVLPTFIIPNGFSPNGDGYNDYWIIDNIQLFPDCEVEVFNRWGEPLFYSKGYNTPWNGTYGGKPVPVGTYYYLIRLHDKEKKFPDHYTGPLTILR